ncbi:unnamed protein product [Angiostrongylus costaricensis]|uniref:Uncharacterized protein n=1 Tax=Angiostrongylus costaricensis TaxID=334426 RepID=A0A0R3PK31_ANGCS|nr:unnamed protein product [Angiostrongylus costaricensis]
MTNVLTIVTFTDIFNLKDLAVEQSFAMSLTTVDPHHQLRLVAEKLCARVERRYEKRLLQQREQDRADIDLKLADIRAEYSEQYSRYSLQLEREKARLEEQFAQKDRALRLNFSGLEAFYFCIVKEKESALEITRRSLETRLTELMLSKEQLDRVKAEFHAWVSWILVKSYRELLYV